MSHRQSRCSFSCFAACMLLGLTCLAAEDPPPDKEPVVKDTPAALDRAAALKELRDFSPKGMHRRFGPDFAFFHPKGPEEPFPQIWQAPVKEGAKGRRYEIGGPWSKQAGDFSSTQGQILYVPERGLGVDRVTILEWSNNVYSESPEIPWWGGFRPDPASSSWQKACKGQIGVPLGMARGMGAWSNCGVVFFSSGLVATGGTCTGFGSNPTLRFPPNKLPTAITVTDRSEFALITIVDLQAMKGQVAVLALESNGRGFAHEWKEAYPGLANAAVFTGMKLLGYVDLPEMALPTGISAVGNNAFGRVNGRDGNAGMLSEYNLGNQADRDCFYSGGNRAVISSAGYAVVISKHEQKAAFIDLKPLFQRFREMYLTTDENFKKTRNLGPGPEQWPYCFDADPTLKPQVVKVLSHPNPTAVIASLQEGSGARALIASVDGKIGIYEVGGLCGPAAASADGIRLVGEALAGRNPVWLAYSKGSRDSFIVVSRGDREIEWIRLAGNSAMVYRRLKDARLIDPVHVERADTHGTDAEIVTVADFKGRKIINYRVSEAVFSTNGGARFGMGPDGKAQSECGGIMEFPGFPFCISASNVN